MKTSSFKPLIAFFVLSIGLMFLLVLPGILANYGYIELNIPLLPLMILGSWIPNIAAFLVIAFVLKRKGGIKSLFRRWIMFRVSSWWYLAAFSPVLIAIAGGVFLSAGNPSEIQSADAAFLLGFLVISLITGAMGEELGWRGFALPWLQTRFNALWSSLILGIIWSIWHLPLWFTGMGWEETSFFLFAWLGITLTVILTWLCNNTRGNLLLVTLFHMSFNYGMGLMGQIWSLTQPQIVKWMAVVLSVYALAVIVVKGPDTLNGKAAIPVNKKSRTWID